MIDFNDNRWTTLKGGYRVPFDPRPALVAIRDGVNSDAAWKALWEGLHHQGDVGEASYAAVPFLVEFCAERGEYRWDLFALVAVIELARTESRNPPLPEWIEADCRAAIEKLAQLAAREILKTSDPLQARAMLAILAVRAGQRGHADHLLSYSDDEVRTLE